MSITDLRLGASSSSNVSTPGNGASAAANAWKVEEHELVLGDITAKSINLAKVPSSPSKVKLGIMDGPGELDYGVDYEMLGGVASAYTDIFNATLNDSGQLIANESALGFQSYAQCALLNSPGDSVFFSFTPNTTTSWGFVGYDFATAPSWSLPSTFPRIPKTSNNEDLAFLIYRSVISGNEDTTNWRSIGMTEWGPIPITGGTCSLVIGSSNKLEVYYNGTFIGESFSQVPLNGWKIYLVFGHSLLFPDITVGATTTLSWSGKVLDGLLEVGDKLKVTYTTNNP